MAAHLKLAGADDGGSQMLDGVRVPTEVRLVAVDALLPYARNAKTHGKAQVAALARSMREVGFTNPLLIADGGILAGHGRLMAAKSLGLTRVPCIDLSHLPEDKRRALVLWDNRSAEIDSGYDLEMLKLETDDLRALGLDLEAETGFAEEDLAKLFEGMVDAEPPGGGGDPDAVPDVPVEPHSRLGDVWVIRDADGCDLHRVMCGSATEPADWGTLMAGDDADLVVTDPPYGVNIGEKNAKLAAHGGRKSKTGSILNDDLKDAPLYDLWLAAFQQYLRVTRPGAPIYAYFSWMRTVPCLRAFFDSGYKFQSILLWKKSHFTIGRTDFQNISEPVIYGWSPGAAHTWLGGRKLTTIADIGDGSPFRNNDGRWVFPRGDDVYIVDGVVSVEEKPGDFLSEQKPNKSELHPTQKPVDLMRRHMRHSATRGSIVVDGFGGSGSTAVAAHAEGMRSRIMELSPAYVDTITRRLEMFVGARAVHAVTGEAFPGDGEVRTEASGHPVVEPSDSPDVF